MRLLGLSGSLTAPSKTWLTLNKALEFAKEYEPTIEAKLIHLGDYELQFCDGRDPSAYEGDTRTVIEAVVHADAFIVATLIYRGSMTGALKNLFDLIPNDSLQGKVIGFIATGGTYHHFLAIEHQLKPLAGYFQAHVVPSNVYAHNEHFSEGTLHDQGIITRLQELAESVVELTKRIGQGRTGASGPSIPRRSLI